MQAMGATKERQAMAGIRLGERAALGGHFSLVCKGRGDLRAPPRERVRKNKKSSKEGEKKGRKERKIRGIFLLFCCIVLRFFNLF